MDSPVRLDPSEFLEEGHAAPSLHVTCSKCGAMVRNRSGSLQAHREFHRRHDPGGGRSTSITSVTSVDLEEARLDRDLALARVQGNEAWAKVERLSNELAVLRALHRHRAGY